MGDCAEDEFEDGERDDVTDTSLRAREEATTLMKSSSFDHGNGRRA